MMIGKNYMCNITGNFTLKNKKYYLNNILAVILQLKITNLNVNYAVKFLHYNVKVTGLQ